MEPFHLKMKHSSFISRSKEHRSYYRLWTLSTRILMYEFCSLLTIVTMKCKATIINTLFLHYNLCQDIMLTGSLSCSFTLITCLTNFYSYYYSWFTFKSNNYNLICNFIRRQLTSSAIFHVLQFRNTRPECTSVPEHSTWVYFRFSVWGSCCSTLK